MGVRKVQLEELDTKRENLEARMAAAETRLEAKRAEVVATIRAMSTGKKSKPFEERPGSANAEEAPAEVEDVQVKVQAEKADAGTYEAPAGPEENKGGCSVM